MAQTFLQAGKQCFLIACLGVNNTVSRKTGLGKGGCEQILFCHTPQHEAIGSSGDPSREKRCRGTVNRTVSSTRDFMERSAREAAAGKLAVDLGNSERQDVPHLRMAPLEVDDTGTKGFYGRVQVR